MDATLTAKADQLARELAPQAATAADLNALLRSVMKSALERVLDPEMDANGHSRRAVQGDTGRLTLDASRDRAGTPEPRAVGTRRCRLSGFDDTVLAPSATGLTTRGIQDVVKELYGVEVPPAVASQITADLDTAVTARKTRRVDLVWPVVYSDGIAVPVRGEGGRRSPHTARAAPGVNLQGKKELPGPRLGETGGARFWPSCLNDQRGRVGERREPEGRAEPQAAPERPRARRRWRARRSARRRAGGRCRSRGGKRPWTTSPPCSRTGRRSPSAANVSNPPVPPLTQKF